MKPNYSSIPTDKFVPRAGVAVHVDDDGDSLAELQLVPLPVLPSALLHHGRGQDVPHADLGAVGSVEVEVDRALEALVLGAVEVDVFRPFH